MAWVNFHEDGYSFISDGRILLFNEDQAHELLFRYAYKDTSQLPRLFEKYISMKINIETLELTDNVCDYNDIAEANEILLSLHPYYEFMLDNVWKNEIIKYFNNLLAYKHFEKQKTHKEQQRAYAEEWYTKRLSSLLQFFPLAGNESFLKFYADYFTIVTTDYDPEVEYLITPTSPKIQQPIGFSDEIRAQKTIRQILFWVFDASVPHIEKLAINQRLWLYGMIFENFVNPIGMKVSKQLSFSPFTLFHYKKGGNYDVEHIMKMDEVFSPLYSLKSIYLERDDMPKKMLDALSRVTEYAKKASMNNVHEEYEIINICQLLYLEILTMIQNDTIVKRCRNCSMYFVAPNRKVSYCERIVESGIEQCSVIGPKRSFQKKLYEDYPLKIYTRAYKTRHARRLKKTMTEESFLSWCDEAKGKLEKVRNGELGVSTFEEWLNADKKGGNKPKNSL